MLLYDLPSCLRKRVKSFSESDDQATGKSDDDQAAGTFEIGAFCACWNREIYLVAFDVDDGNASSLMELFGMMRDSETMRLSRLECNPRRVVSSFDC